MKRLRDKVRRHDHIGRLLHAYIIQTLKSSGCLISPVKIANAFIIFKYLMHFFEFRRYLDTLGTLLQTLATVYAC